jgi:hypothetical protein
MLASRGKRMNPGVRKRKIILTIVTVIIVGSASFVAIYLRLDSNEVHNQDCTISGRVLDLKSGRLVFNEIGVKLDRVDGRMDRQIQFPRWEGTFYFGDLQPGKYLLHFNKSYSIIRVIDDPNAQYLEGGYIFPEPIEIELEPGDVFDQDYYFSFHAHFEGTGLVEKPVHVENRVFGYSDSEAWPVEENLKGKTMHFEVTWTNTLLSRVDLTIQVLNVYNSTVVDFSAGEKTERLSVEINDEFFEMEEEVGYFLWRVLADSQPSPDWRRIPVEIYWYIE